MNLKRIGFTSIGLALALAGGLAACTGEPGPAGLPGPSGPSGAACTVAANEDGTRTITCGTTTVTVERGSEGAAGSSCTVADNPNGTKTISCDDNTSVTVNDGAVGPQGPSGPFAFNVAAEMPTALNVKIDSVTIASPPVVRFTVTDAAGRGAVGFKAGASGGQLRFNIAKLVPAATAGDPDAWVNYVNRTATEEGTTTPLYAQGTSDRTGGLVDNKNGTYDYTFSIDLATVTHPVTQALIGYDASLTHRLVVQLNGTINTRAIPSVNAVFDFVPAGGAPTLRRDIVTVASCNECHGKLVAHGSRYDAGYCVVCHNSGSIDPVTKQSVDFSAMIHGIHSAGKRAADLAPEYKVGNDSFAEVTFPQDLGQCRKCHDGANAATPQGDNWKTPNKQSCGGCHASAKFAAHMAPQATNAACALCHKPELVAAVHMTDNVTPHNPAVREGAFNFTYDVKDVTVNASNQPVVVFRIMKYDSAAPTPAPLVLTAANLAALKLGSGPSFLLAYAMPQGANLAPAEYNNLGRAAGQPATVSVTGLLATDAAKVTGTITGPDASGYYTATLTGTPAAPVSYPVGAKLRALALQGYFKQTGFFPDAVAPASKDLARHAVSVVKSVTGDTQRREVVDSAKCANCHEWFEAHGGNRVYEVGVCVTCHIPNLTSSGRGSDPATIGARLSQSAKDHLTAAGHDPADPLTFPEKSNGFKEMIHGIHSADMRSNHFNFVRDRGNSGVFYYDFAEVTFPGDLANCQTCHKPGTYGTALPAGALLTTGRIEGVTDNRTAVLAARTAVPNATDTVTTPTASACFSCHDNPLAKAHMELNGAKVLGSRSVVDGNAVETCSVCHGAGRDADVALVHGR